MQGWPVLVPTWIINFLRGESWLPDVAGVTLVWSAVLILWSLGT